MVAAVFVILILVDPIVRAGFADFVLKFLDEWHQSPTDYFFAPLALGVILYELFVSRSAVKNTAVIRFPRMCYYTWMKTVLRKHNLLR